ncbi:MFS transporter [Plantactinospora sp. S1510]|uniref:MFS transporter n=1 Tax=Plantactinospora alkalitolerans TaxID=2789879 RepID=A0ABS0GTH6_9ACTN|nr:MFS transporter [Plantactinospora alkalitolerans]MBF9129359.1 MFS transporter [Plantactinospora alkalitolerans]
MPEISTPIRSALRWWIFAVILVADILDLLSTTVTNIAAPSVVRDLHAPVSLTPWLGSTYALALGSILVVGGRIGDRYGYRRSFLLGIAGFGAASLLCALAWDSASIIGARLLQGAFGALLIPQGFSILLRAFPRTELGRVFGLFGPLMAVGSISGPVVAGLLIEADPLGLGWRGVFAANLLLALVVLLIAARVLPADRGRRAVAIDPLATLLLMLGVLGMLGGLIQSADGGWTPLPVFAIVAGLALLALFSRHQLRGGNPLLAPALFRNRGFVAGLLVSSLFFAAVAGLLYVTSLYLQSGLRLAPLRTSEIMLPLSVGIIIASFSARGAIVRLGRRLVTVGLALTGTGVLGYLAIVGAKAPAWLFTVPLFLCGLGMGCCFGSLFAVTLGDVDEEQTGSASGTLNAVQQIVNAVGSAVVSTLFLTVGAVHGARSGLLLTLLGVLGVIVLCGLCLPLLPRAAAADHH